MHGPSNPDALARAAALFACDPASLAPRVRGGMLDLLGGDFTPTFTQRTLDTAFTAWLYDALRDRATSTIGMPDFQTEVRGDALALPFRDAAFAKVNCSGGLHQMPDLDRALGEMARVAMPGARFTGSSFARDGTEESGLRGWLWRRWSLHFVPVVALGRAVEAAGFGDVRAQMAGSAMGYAWGRRAS
jgi:SAM-dependent methyltransferase